MKRISSFSVIVFSLSLLSLSLTGCKSLTGLIDAADEFGCPLGKGTNCTTLTATHKKVTKELNEKKSEDSLKVAPPIKKSVPEADTPDASKSSSLESVGSKEPKAVSHNKELDKWVATYGKHLQEPAKNPAFQKSSVTKELAKGNANSHWRNTNGAKARMPERVMFLWVLPWVDTDGDLHGESRLWVKVRDAKWGVEKLRLEAMNRGAPEMTP